MGEVRHAELGLDDPSGPRQGGLRIPVPPRQGARLGGQGLVLGQDPVRPQAEGLGFVPNDAPGQGVAAELGAPEVAPEDGDPARNAHHPFHPGDGLGRCRVEGLDAGPEAGRMGDQGGEHPGQAQVLGEEGTAVELAGAVFAAQPGVADEAELGRGP